jgi:FAD/FMN-containing dehydrogenase
MSILAYAPDDLTVAVTADTTLAALQEHLAARHQWLPLDPWDPEKLTIGEIIDHDLSGPRRYGYGTVREHILGMVADLADGKRIKAGANVVKNAAGYDLCRLFTGAHGELAAVREVCFKVQPRPEAEQFLCA